MTKDEQNRLGKDEPSEVVNKWSERTWGDQRWDENENVSEH
jgi:hypothetical protein